MSDRQYAVLCMKDRNMDSGIGSIMKEIGQRAEKLDFATITIHIHDSKIVSVEVTEKKRFNVSCKSREGGDVMM